jgi:hypothetical protein
VACERLFLVLQGMLGHWVRRTAAAECSEQAFPTAHLHCSAAGLSRKRAAIVFCRRERAGPVAKWQLTCCCSYCFLLCSIFAAHEEPLPQEAVPTGVNEIKGPAV